MSTPAERLAEAIRKQRAAREAAVAVGEEIRAERERALGEEQTPAPPEEEPA